MKKYALLFLIAFVSTLLADTVSENQVILSTFPEKNTFEVGEKVHLKFVIQNTHNFPVYILLIDSDIGVYFHRLDTNEKISHIGVHYTEPLHVPDMSSFILIDPGECYTNTIPEPILINQSTNGTYWLEHNNYTYPISESGFILKGALYSSDYPMEHLKDMDGLKGLDHSVPLFRKGSVYSELEIIHHGKSFRIKEK
jgi:hypothetical protein